MDLESNKSLSAAKTILAILYQVGEGTLTSFFPHKYAKKYGYGFMLNTYHTSLHRLKTRGLIKKKGKKIFFLTPKGQKEAFFSFINAEAKSYKPVKQKWDGKWRIIFFDIPEKKRLYRDYLRKVIRTIGFKELQKSTWIYPYKIPSFLEEILWEENIKQYTRLITTLDIEYDKDVKKLFKLTIN